MDPAPGLSAAARAPLPEKGMAIIMEKWENGPPKFGTKKWFENYWYHFKWHTIIGVVAAIMLVSFAYDILSKEKFDSTITIVGKAYISDEQRERLCEIAEQYEVDRDGDGKVNVDVVAIGFPEDDDTGMNAQVFMAAQTRFSVEMTDGESMILIMDDYAYDMIGDPLNFVDLSAYSDKAFDDGRKIPLSDTVFCDDPLTEALGDSLFLTFRAADTHAASKNKKAKENYQYQTELLDNILNERKALEG